MTDDARDKAVLEAAHKIIAITETYEDYAAIADSLRLILRDRARLAELCETQELQIADLVVRVIGAEEQCERQARVVEAARSALTTCHHQRAGKLLKVALDTLDAPPLDAARE